jgi:hypothetical protein
VWGGAATVVDAPGVGLTFPRVLGILQNFNFRIDGKLRFMKQKDGGFLKHKTVIPQNTNVLDDIKTQRGSAKKKPRPY